MAELSVPIHNNIGPGYLDWDTFEWVPGTTAQDIRMYVEWMQYSGETIDRIVLEIGSCQGGSVLEGLEIYNYLRSLKLPIHTRILALVASMGTIVALAGDTIECEYASLWMIHRPSFREGTSSSTSVDLRADADALDKMDSLMSDIYMARTGQTAEIVAGWMGKDTWLTASEAQTLGLVDTVNPLQSTQKVPTEVEATARRQRLSAIVARIDKTAAPTKAQITAKLPSISASFTTPVMSKPAVKPVPRAAAKPAPKAKTLGQRVLAALGITEDEAEADGDDEATAEVTSTELDNGAFFYHDGALAQGLAVFNDEALTEVPADGEYVTADNRTITIAAGIIEALAEASAEDTTEANGDYAALLARIEKLEKKDVEAQTTISNLTAQVDKFKKAVPAAPTPKPRAVSGSQIDPKEPVANGGKKSILAGATQRS